MRFLRSVLLSRVFFGKDFKRMAHQGPRPLVICGPSGSGKSTILKRLFDEYPKTFSFSVSHTTRKPRPGEENGIHYYFVSKDDMENGIRKNEFVETATFCGNIYGTSVGEIKRIQSSGKVCILDIELNGVEQIKKSNLLPIYVFNNPPSLLELERRLRKRNTETEETLKQRLKSAEIEIAYGLTPGNFNKIINNIDIDEAYKEFQEFVINELKAQEASGINICWE